MSFRLSRSILSNQPTQRKTRGRWKDGQTPPRRRKYGTSHVPVFPTVDLITPLGSYTQAGSSSPTKSPSRYGDSSPSRYGDGSPTRYGDGSPTRYADGSPTRYSSPPRAMSFQFSPSPPPKRDHRRLQWEKWAKDIIPSLVPVFLELCRKSKNLRSIETQAGGCSCQPTVRKLPITIVSLAGMSPDSTPFLHSVDRPLGISSTSVCSCQPVALLLRSGYFASAPTRPTYAFDIHMLEFVRELHLRSPPNKTAWSAALEVFLSNQGFKIGGQDVIRRKLSTSLKWYTYLRAFVDGHVQNQISNALWQGPNDKESDDEEEDHDDRAEDAGWDDVEDEGLEYLVRRCPACFGENMSGEGGRCVSARLFLLSSDEGFQRYTRCHRVPRCLLHSEASKSRSWKDGRSPAHPPGLSFPDPSRTRRGGEAGRRRPTIATSEEPSPPDPCRRGRRRSP